MHTRLVAKQRVSGTVQDEWDRLLERSLGMVCIAGFDGRLKRVSPAVSAAFGYKQDEMASMPLGELVHPDDWPDTEALIQELARGRGVHGAEVRARAKDGNYRWILWDGVPCVDDEVFLATGQDITSRKSVEEELFESQERFQLIAGATGEAVWDWDLRNDRWWCNEVHHRMFGIPDDEIGSRIKWWQRRIHPDDLERVLAAIPPPVINGNQKWLLEYRMRRRDGTYAHVYDRGFVIFDDSGNPVRMVGSVIDVSKLKRAEEELRESELRFRLAAKATRDVTWDWDMRRGTVQRGEGLETLFGYTADSVGSDLDWWVERTHPDDRDRVRTEIASLHARRLEQYATEYRFRRADGSYADVLERGFVMYDDRGKPVRMVGSMMDISHRRRVEELLSAQRAELAHTDRVSTMGEFATGLAHELNQPLAAIANYAESCKQALESQAPEAPEKLRTWIEKIAANTHRAGEIIRRLRGFMRKSEPRREAIDLNELVVEVIELVESGTRRRNMRLRWEPSAGTRPMVDVDHVQIQQVLVNLLRNAYEAAADMPPERRLVTMEVHRNEDFVEFSVADLGRGVAAQHRDRVFDAFFSTKSSGVGFGLAISRSIVEDHGGKLWLCPNPRHGTTFHFTLPISGAHHGRSANRNSRR